MTTSFKAKGTLTVAGTTYGIFRLSACGPAVERLQMSLKVLLENLLRHEDGRVVRHEHVEAVLNWDPKAVPSQEIAFHPVETVDEVLAIALEGEPDAEAATAA